MLLSLGGTLPVPAKVWSHKEIVANASLARNRTCEGEFGWWAKWTRVATAFFVLVMATTAPGSVVKLYRVETAASFSSASRRIAHVVRKVKMASVDNFNLLIVSVDKFWKHRRLSTRSSGTVDSAALMRICMKFLNVVKCVLLYEKRVKFSRISKHLV